MPISRDPGSPPIITGTRQQQLQEYLANYIGKLPGVFPAGNNYPQFAGMTYSQIFTELANKNPNASPYNIATYVETLYIDAQLQRVFTGTIQGTGTVTQAIGQGVLKGAIQAAKPYSIISSPLAFLTSSAFWVRAGEVVFGLVLVAVGMSKLAESSPLASKIVNQVPAIKAARKILK